MGGLRAVLALLPKCHEESRRVRDRGHHDRVNLTMRRKIEPKAEPKHAPKPTRENVGASAGRVGARRIMGQIKPTGKIAAGIRCHKQSALLQALLATTGVR